MASKPQVLTPCSHQEQTARFRCLVTSWSPSEGVHDPLVTCSFQENPRASQHHPVSICRQLSRAWGWNSLHPSHLCDFGGSIQARGSWLFSLRRAGHFLLVPFMSQVFLTGEILCARGGAEDTSSGQSPPKCHPALVRTYPKQNSLHTCLFPSC